MSHTHTAGIITLVLILISKSLFVGSVCAMCFSATSRSAGSFSGNININPPITYRINPFTDPHLGASYEYLDLIHAENGIENESTYPNRRLFFPQAPLSIPTLTEAELGDMAQTETDTERNRRRVGGGGLFIESRDRAKPQRG